MKRPHPILLLCLAAALSTTATAEPAAAGPQLRELHPGRFATGTITLEMKGKQYEFFTTSQALASNLGANIKDPAAKAFAEEMAGKTIESAILRLIAGSLYVSLDGSLHSDPANPTPKEIAGASFGIELTLDPKTHKLKDASLRYSPPGSKTSELQQTSTCTLALESIEKNPDGSFSMSGTFSGTLDKDLMDTPLPSPEAVSGSFQILRVSDKDLILPLLKGN